jgi:Fic family protein
VQASDFEEVAPGRLVKTVDGYWGFAPNPLPPQLEWDAHLISVLSAADRALGRLSGIGQTLPNPHLLIAPFVRREAVLSSRIEGTQSSLSQLYLFEVQRTVEKQVPDVREVANYVRALEYGLDRLASLPVSLRLIRESHERLMEGVRGEDDQPGEFRRDQNWIGAPGCNPGDATYVPPPPNEMTRALHDFEAYLHDRSDLPPLVRVALVHYQFEAIHPFRDGNGRIGRLLITLLLCAEELLVQPLLYLSAFFQRHREEYYARLLAVSQKGQWQEWVTFFLRGIADQAADATQRGRRLLDLHRDFHERCQSKRVSALSLRLIDDLFIYPATTIKRTAASLGVTPRAAQGIVDKLVQAEILSEITGRPRNRVFVAKLIIDAIEAPTASQSPQSEPDSP